MAPIYLANLEKAVEKPNKSKCDALTVPDLSMLPEISLGDHNFALSRILTCSLLKQRPEKCV